MYNMLILPIVLLNCTTNDDCNRYGKCNIKTKDCDCEVGYVSETNCATCSEGYRHSGDGLNRCVNIQQCINATDDTECNGHGYCTFVSNDSKGAKFNCQCINHYQNKTLNKVEHQCSVCQSRHSETDEFEEEIEEEEICEEEEEEENNNHNVTKFVKICQQIIKHSDYSTKFGYTYEQNIGEEEEQYPAHPSIKKCIPSNCIVKKNNKVSECNNQGLCIEISTSLSACICKTSHKRNKCTECEEGYLEVKKLKECKLNACAEKDENNATINENCYNNGECKYFQTRNQYQCDCKHNYDHTYYCKTCINHYTLDSNCTACQQNYDIGKLCSQCKFGWNDSDDCKTCIQGFDIEQNCSKCLQNKDILTRCQTCAPGFSEDVNGACVSNNKKSNTALIVSLSLLGVAAVIIAIIVAILCIRKKKQIKYVNIDENTNLDDLNYNNDTVAKQQSHKDEIERFDTENADD